MTQINQPSTQPHISVAPMMDWTDRHCRYFLRLFSPHLLLYTEMIATGAILYGDRDRFLAHDPKEYPLAIQLGGSTPYELAQCSRIAEDYGFNEVNLNVGCPSSRVQKGKIGACLMAEPDLVAECIHAMQEQVDIPVTVKTRIGIDNFDNFEFLCRFIDIVSKGGCTRFIIHARKAWLNGLNPKQNREIPPLRYEIVRQLKREFPELSFIINGGLNTISAIDEQLKQCDGVMIGREAYQNPYFLAIIEKHFYSQNNLLPSRADIINAFLPYVRKQLRNNVYLNRLTRHILGLFQGVPGAKAWRRYLSQHAHCPGSNEDVIKDAIAQCASAQWITSSS